MTGPTVCGQPAAERLMFAVRHQASYPQPLPTAAQVALVLDALADHTALEAARVHDRTVHDPGGTFLAEPGALEECARPGTTSTARWLHDVADDLRHPGRL